MHGPEQLRVLSVGAEKGFGKYSRLRENLRLIRYLGSSVRPV